VKTQERTRQLKALLPGKVKRFAPRHPSLDLFAETYSACDPDAASAGSDLAQSKSQPAAPDPVPQRIANQNRSSMCAIAR